MNNSKIYIPNLSLGNTKSVVNMVRKAGGLVQIAGSPSELLDAEKIILPGVGSYDAGMTELHDGGWVEALNDLVLVRKRPILGICLGMQFFFDGSEEGVCPGLGWIPGTLVRFCSTPENPIKVPHMGWNTLKVKRTDSLFDSSDEEVRFYFVHSYHAVCKDEYDLVATAHHGSDVTAAVQRGNIYGVQFHPEKSHKFGLSLFNNFLSV
ncbi:imidazole glycerol phosphate synthase subunit HisH [Pedobacter faecalis]|uniref:imidazole glycerol phosphate synthase subunit HisH n=1 Tax=Pedobacter faecalis TaxID=3041495 RepID=UPI00254C9B3F|nr:imidazole glycerol phosphate synthase subunit HisH [Pedobacter sp. ELA7]